ncbi:twin-arginine translocation signal domain-containing protein [Pyxidicoccus parkwayensis]|uniref:Twin-arginine translocation signal domain-containing protein n=1 Tax=Pyxidicoccus parkwayensis TaxID=2813578 RepID=A0ABX7NRH8_9BACT|nr:twin-arginine translocation signal domain-containing protein [Pyxidicoccus parkwaysis]QSQ21380.1 twin-arginine translocation signal domain-containing protein [Pyxidicoccus parkwaysis]
MSETKNPKPQAQQETPETQEADQSRRGFLGKLGLGAAAAAMAVAPSPAQAATDCEDPAFRAREIVTAFNFNLAAGHLLSEDQLKELNTEVDETVRNAVVRDVIGARLKDFGLIQFDDIGKVSTSFSLHINVQK